ncbi:MAG: hypothetical protein QXW79_00345 [Thermoplasmata archaeon]
MKSDYENSFYTITIPLSNNNILPIWFLIERRDKLGNWISKEKIFAKKFDDFVKIFEKHVVNELDKNSDKEKNIYDKLVKSGAERRIVPKEGNRSGPIVPMRDGNVVKEYNSLFPFWSIIRDDFFKSPWDEIGVPYILNKYKYKIAVNQIDICLVDSNPKLLAGKEMIPFGWNRGIRAEINEFFNSHHKYYIPMLLFEFIKGTLPSYVVAITFHKTIIGTCDGRYSRGFGVRIYTENQVQIPELYGILTTRWTSKAKCVDRITIPFFLKNDAAKEIKKIQETTTGMKETSEELKKIIEELVKTVENLRN